ncbi:MAG: hypothetical protein CL472_01065 [Acidobacteria bacterium]|nr:hypothetical protein [Acidobacteriota bacterium]
MKVSFDIDNVLADIVGTARNVLEEDMGLAPGTIEIIDFYDSPFKIKGDKTPISVDHSFWSDKRVISDCRVFPRAVEAVKLADEAGILAGYITRRPAAIEEATAAWFSSVGLPQKIAIHVGTENAETTFDMCKSEACSAIGATHHVDDHADEFQSVHAAGVSMVVVDAFIGRAKRKQILSNYPSVPLVPDAWSAVQHLLSVRNS